MDYIVFIEDDHVKCSCVVVWNTKQYLVWVILDVSDTNEITNELNVLGDCVAYAVVNGDSVLLKSTF
jgi:hypothetical protein